MQADVAGRLHQQIGDARHGAQDSFYGRGFRQVREPHAEAMWAAAAREPAAIGSSSSSSAAPPTLGAPEGVDVRTLPLPPPTSRMDRSTGQLAAGNAVDIEDIPD